MDSALNSLEFDRVLSLIALEAKSEPGREAVARRRPLATLEACEEAQAELAEMVTFYAREGLLPCAGLSDVDAVFAREPIALEDSWQILRSARATQAVREALLRTEPPLPRLRSRAEAIDDLGDVIAAVNRYFTKDGKLREDATPELRSLRTRVQQKRSQIQKTLLDIMNRSGDLIQDPIVTLRGDRYCIPVRTERRSDLPGILHERSGSGASVFIEPIATVELNNDLADLLIQERAELARITGLIARELLDNGDRIRTSVAAAGELDAIQACAVIHRDMEASRPTFTMERRLELLEARHPLLDERLATLRRTAFGEDDDARVIPTTILLQPEAPALVISGPNAGGKTVALKSAGLITAMAMSGLPVPAADGTIIPMIRKFHVLIGDDQDLLQHLSTFSAYLARLKRILASTDEESLVLLDELGSGTDPEEGGAIAAAVVEHLLQTGCLLIATTHLNALKNVAIQDKRIGNASMEFNPDSGRPTFRLIQGVPGRSRAIEVAAMIGLPDSIVQSARARLGDQHGQADRLLSELQKQMHVVNEERERQQSLVAELERRVAEARKHSEELNAEKRSLAKGMREQFDKTEREVRQRLDEELRRLRAIDRKERDRIQGRELIASVTAPLTSMAPSQPSRPVRTGDRVEHAGLRLTGTVTEVDGSRAYLSSGGKRIQVDVADLMPVETAEKSRNARTIERETQTLSEPDIAAELNLIGRRVEEAIDESDKFIDRSLMDGRGAIRLIHGHGTGKLKKALRDYLKQHRGVKSFRPGNEKEGGDGATVAILDV